MQALSSLAHLVDIAVEWDFLGAPVAASKRAGVARAIARQQGAGHCYGALFGLTDTDRAEGYRLFTGERLAYSARARHVLGEEALRALITLGGGGPPVQRAIQAASEYMTGRLLAYRDPGVYCCTTCAPAVWRALGADAYPQVDREAWVVNGVGALRRRRDGKGTWGSFPRYYTLLALLDFQYPPVLAELRYALPFVRQLTRQKGSTVYAARRRLLGARALARCS
jgi:hypothetical protein